MSAASPVVLVTGGSGAIGTAIAQRLLRDGWWVALTARHLDDLEDVRESMPAELRGRVSLYQHDVSDPDQCREVVRQVAAEHEGLDALVNNAGTMVRKTALETSLEDWNRVLSVNLTGAFLMATACYDLLADSARGAVVSTSSTHGILAAKGNIAYSTSKAGLDHLTRLLALEWAEAGIRVNAVAPTVVPSRQNYELLADPAYVARKIGAIPLGRPVAAEHVAAAIAYLLSDDAGSTTGQTLVLDGGESLA
jgi:NAD(P)-dependent dehydrogenase (short-subunit alcohol dehydrogenase family)